jgi:hypothetical protein
MFPARLINPELFLKIRQAHIFLLRHVLLRASAILLYPSACVNRIGILFYLIQKCTRNPIC